METHAGPSSRATDVVAAGAVVSRPGGEVLLVHRPRYDDWSFPKGKLDPGEHLSACAVREVEEETGLRVRLGAPLPGQRYRTGGRPKSVHYWSARVVGDDEVLGYRRADEIDEVVWLSWDEAARTLSYDHDRETLTHARATPRRTRALVVLRHGQALPRKGWDGDDRLRPLVTEGVAESERLSPVLAAYGATRVVTSSSTRCVDTVVPYAGEHCLAIEATDGLSEEDATTATVGAVVRELVAAPQSAVLCTHRPVLPEVFAALGVPDPGLEKAGMLVVHHRRGTVVATELLGAV